MPSVETYTFTHKEILELLIKKADLHDGRWMLQVIFGFSAGNFGPNDDNSSPGAITVVNSIGLTRAKPEAPKSLVLDATEVNPAST